MRQAAVWLMALATTAVLALVLVGIVVVPQWLHPQLSPAELQGVTSADRRVELQQDQARLQNDVRATLLQGAAGVLLVAGVVATLWQVQVSRQGQITERFARAVDHLGGDKPDVRVGGIYTLERIAKDSRPDRATVAAVLETFVRNHAPWMVGAPAGPEHPTATIDEQLPWLQHRAPDIGTAMLVLGRRPPSKDERPLYLSRVDLRGAYLADAQLSRVALRYANLARAVMPRVQLEGSDLHRADLRHADLQRARLRGANLGGCSLQGADLQGADLQGADLRGSNLRGAKLEGADLTGVQDDATTVWPDGVDPRRPRGRTGEPAA
jgi:hypothetical protein